VPTSKPARSKTGRQTAPLRAKPRSRPDKTAKAGAGQAEPRISAEELAEISRRELADAVGGGGETLEVAVTAEQMAASYAALIRDTVVGYWSRPPSARNGMEALLAIQLVPTGRNRLRQRAALQRQHRFRSLGDQCGGKGRQLPGAERICRRGSSRRPSAVSNCCSDPRTCVTDALICESHSVAALLPGLVSSTAGPAGYRDYPGRGRSDADRRGALCLGGRRGTAPEDLALVMQEDFSRSGQFEPVTAADMLGFPSREEELFYRDWRAIASEYVLIGRAPAMAAGFPFATSSTTCCASAHRRGR
jgi:hypothetical protein